jgi:hypothetical protein
MLAIVKIERQGTGAVFRVNLVANCTPLERRRSSGSLIVVAAQNPNLPLVGVVRDDLARGEGLPADVRQGQPHLQMPSSWIEITEFLEMLGR